MRPPVPALVCATLVLALALAGCTKTPPPETVTSASVPTNGPTSSDAASSGSPSSPTDPTPASPSPTPASPPPTDPTPPPPASTPPDSYVNKSGWATPNSQTDPNSTIRLTFTLLSGAKNFTVRGGDATITPGGDQAGAPFTLTVTDPQGKPLANASTNSTTPVPLPDVPPETAPQTRTFDVQAASLLPGEYTVTLKITPGMSEDQTGLGERYSLSVYVHY